MSRVFLTAIALALTTSSACADYLLLLDPTQLDVAVATRGAGPDGRQVRPRAVAAACIRDGVLGPAAFSPRFDRCRAAAAVPGLRDAVAALPVAGAEAGTTVIGLVNAGGIIAVEPRRGLACLPGDCNRDVFEGATYPTDLVGRPDPPPPLVPLIEQLTVDPVVLTAGESATLSWAAVDVASCTLETGESGLLETVPASGGRVVAPAEDTVWTLTCAAPGGTALAQTVVTVTQPPEAPEIILFAPTRDDVPAGGRTTLVWETRRAETCALSDGNGPVVVSPSARTSVLIGQDTRFVLACQNAAGWVASTTEVLVTTDAQAPTIESFEIDRSIIARGDGVFASWQAPGATRCRLRDGGQATTWRLRPQGQMNLAPALSTDFILTCRNAYGSDSAGISVTVADSAEPLRVLSFELTHIPGGQRRGSDGMSGGDRLQLARPGLVHVNWASESALACRISDDAGRAASVPANGTRIIRIGETTTMQINCVSRGAQAQSLAQAQVLGEALFFDDFEG